MRIEKAVRQVNVCSDDSRKMIRFGSVRDGSGGTTRSLTGRT